MLSDVIFTIYYPSCRVFFIYIVNANKSGSKIQDDLEKVQAND